MSNLRLLRPSPSAHEDAFVSRYDWLLGRAVRFTHGNRQAAEDLVHDTFVQWRLHAPELGDINNLDGYLYGTLRHVHRSGVRRGGRRAEVPLETSVFDSAELALRSFDHAHSAQIRSELSRICDYAVARKAESKSASVLVLRFFFGYFPAEIALLIKSTRTAVDQWMRLARREAEEYLAQPPGAVSAEDRRCAHAAHAEASTALETLRARIFDAPHGRCLPSRVWRDRYSDEGAEPITTPELAHLVSCERCLSYVLGLLNLDSWRDRHPESRAEHSSAGHRASGVAGATSRRGRVVAAPVIVALLAVAVLLAGPQTVLSAIADVARRVVERVLEIIVAPAPLPARILAAPVEWKPTVKIPVPASSSAPVRRTPRRVSPGAGELLRLELDAWDRLDRLGATLAGQASFARDDNRVRVEIVAESAARKADILAALAPLDASPFFSSRVRTFDEVRASRRPSTEERVITREFGITEARPAGHAPLAAYLARTGGPATSDAVARAADRLVVSAGRVRREAWLLKRLADRFPAADRATFDIETDERWRRLMVRHLTSLHGDVRELESTLAAIFEVHDERASAPLMEPEFRVDAALQELLQATLWTERAVRSAFAVAADDVSTIELIEAGDFWTRMRTANDLIGRAIAHLRGDS